MTCEWQSVQHAALAERARGVNCIARTGSGNAAGKLAADRHQRRAVRGQSHGLTANALKTNGVGIRSQYGHKIALL